MEEIVHHECTLFFRSLFFQLKNIVVYTFQLTEKKDSPEALHKTILLDEIHCLTLDFPMNIKKFGQVNQVHTFVQVWNALQIS